MDWPDEKNNKRFHQYVGEWYNDQMHGIGVYTDIRGRERKGKYENGQRLFWFKDENPTK